MTLRPQLCGASCDWQQSASACVVWRSMQALSAIPPQHSGALCCEGNECEDGAKFCASAWRPGGAQVARGVFLRSSSCCIIPDPATFSCTISTSIMNQTACCSTSACVRQATPRAGVQRGCDPVRPHQRVQPPRVGAPGQRAAGVPAHRRAAAAAVQLVRPAQHPAP